MSESCWQEQVEEIKKINLMGQEEKEIQVLESEAIKPVVEVIDDYEKSNIEYKENLKPNYKISCSKCSQVFYRKRIAKNFQNRYRCGICNGKLNVVKLTY